MMIEMTVCNKKGKKQRYESEVWSSSSMTEALVSQR